MKPRVRWGKPCTRTVGKETDLICNRQRYSLCCIQRKEDSVGHHINYGQKHTFWKNSHRSRCVSKSGSRIDIKSSGNIREIIETHRIEKKLEDLSSLVAQPTKNFRLIFHPTFAGKSTGIANKRTLRCCGVICNDAEQPSNSQ